MANIYDQYATAFANVSAYVVLFNGEKAATIAFKRTAHRVYAYIQWFGTPMVRGHASGGGYDKRTAACASAVQKIAKDADKPNPPMWAEFSAALWADTGPTWEDQLRRAGFAVLQAV